MPRFIVSFIICLFILSASFVGASEQSVEFPRPELKLVEPITAGVVRKEYYWETASGPVKINVIEVDLKNPYVQIDAIPGAGKFTQRLNVSAIAKNTGAVAVINGDFYNMQAEGAPIGPMVVDQRLVSTPAKIENIFALGITSDRKAYIEAFSFNGKVTASNGNEFSLSGLNKAIYWEEPNGVHSHINKLHLYNDLWGGKTRGNDSYTTPTEMLIENEKVISIVQGQYFDSPVPEGMEILRGHGEAANFLTENFKQGDRIEVEYAIAPSRDWNMVIGGHALLVDQGKLVPYTKDLSALGGIRARTAVGINNDGTLLYLVGVEGRTTASKGLSLANLSKFFVEIGVFKAMNLDGGGSTTMVSRPLGEWDTKRVFPTELGVERLVVSALGIYTNAPPGDLQGLIIEGERVLLINEQATYSLKGYDIFYNPKDINDLPVQWFASGHVHINDKQIIGLEPGPAKISVSAGSIIQEFPIEVVGKKDIVKKQLTSVDKQVNRGSEIMLKLTLLTGTGNEKIIDASLVEWQLYGFQGSVTKEGLLNIAEVGVSDIGFVVARYQDYSAPLALKFAEVKRFVNFDNLQDLVFQGYPQGVVGNLSLTSNPMGDETVARLEYDFSKVSETAAAYINFAGGGISIDDNAQGVLLDVYGDGGNQWLRAEIMDAKGNLHRFDLSPGISWTGWKTLELSLQDKGLVYPLSLKRIYVACLVEQREQRQIKGSILLKDLRLKYDRQYHTPQPKVLELTIGSKELWADGSLMEMDVAPVIVDGRTLVPVRFVSEALSAEAKWNADTRNVTIIKGFSWIDLWPDENLMVINGEAIALDVAPQLIQGRTMLPLRVVADALGLSVYWSQETKSVLLR